jgi:hypothetical protein
MPRTDAKADALYIPMHFSTPTHFLLTLDINATHFNGLPPFPNFEISPYLFSSSSVLLQTSLTSDRSLKLHQILNGFYIWLSTSQHHCACSS